MKAIELVEILNKMPKDAEVSYLDTFWESEGWGKDAEIPYYIGVRAVEYNEEDNLIELS